MVKNKLKIETVRLVESFKKLLEESGLVIDSMIIFGSQTKGNANKDSDIDVCVVSPDFGKNDVFEMQMLLKKARKIDSRIEPYPINSEYIKSNYSPIVNEIINYGVLV